MKKASKVVSCLLCLSLIAGIIPEGMVNADSGTSQEFSQQTTAQSPERKIVEELTDKRDANIKQFLLEDGSFMAVEYPEPVHYQENGKWVDIDNTLSSTEEEQNKPSINSVAADAVSDTDPVGFENKKNDFDVWFSKNVSSSNLVRIKKDKSQITWGLDGVAADNTSSATLSNSQDDSEAQQKNQTEAQKYNDKFLDLPNITSGCTYSSVFPGVDLKYTLQSQSVKEYLTLKNKGCQNTYTFNYELNNLEMQEEDGSVRFYDPSSPDKTEYTVPSPYVYDAKGSKCDNVNVTLSGSKGKYQLSITVDASWLASSDRAFPVVIDPSTISPLVQTNITYVSSNQTGAHYGESIVKVGNDSSSGVCRAYMNFTYPNLGSSATVTNAELSLTGFSYDSDDLSSYEIDASSCDGSFDAGSLLYSNAPAPNSLLTDFCASDVDTSKWNWDITKIANEWYDNGNNEGVVLKAKDESRQTRISFDSFGADPNPDEYPCLTLYFVNNLGLEDYWTFHTSSLQRSGTGSVNDYTGNLVYQIPLMSENGSRMPLSLTLTYNSFLATSEISNGIKSGMGWQLNINQKIGLNTDTASTYYYTDEDGTQHYFKETDSSSSSYLDEDGLGYTLTFTNNVPTITDKNNGSMVFGNLCNGEYLLTQIKDANGNTIQLNYDGNCVTSISDGSGRLTSFTRDAQNQLRTVTDPSGRVTTLNYSSLYLASIVYPDGKSTQISYLPDLWLYKVTDIDSQSIEYSYNGQHKINKITEDGSDKSTGAWISMAYPTYNTTKFTDNKGRSEIYQFDTLGRTACIQDSDGNAQYYAYDNGSTANTGSLENRNNLTSESKLQKSIVNLLQNGNAETLGYWNELRWNSPSGTTANSTTAYLGNRSLVISKTDQTASSRLIRAQSFSVPAAGGQFTFSGSIKTDSVSNANGGGALLFITYKNAQGGTVNVDGQKITGTNDWDRYSVTASLPAGSYNASACVAIADESGTAYFDCLQVETGSIANRYNLLSNGSFESFDATTKMPKDWSGNYMDREDVTTSDQHSDGSYAFLMNGETATYKSLEQTVPLNCPDTTDVILAGWIKADGIPLSSDLRAYGLHAIVNYTDGSQFVTQSLSANTSLTAASGSDWQYLSGVISLHEPNTANRTVSSVTVFCDYGHEANQAYFDNIQLYRDEFDESYTYDDKGNLVSSKDLAQQNSSFSYDSGNNLIKATDPKGSSFSYVYDSFNNPTLATNQSDVKYSIQTDNSGNPTDTLTTGRTGVSSLQSGTVYYIRANKSRLYLDVQGNTDANNTKLMEDDYNGGLNQQFKIIDTGDGYYKIVAMNSLTSRVIDIPCGQSQDGTQVQIFDDNGSDAQKYKISKNTDGTFSILTKCSSCASGLDVRVPNESTKDKDNIITEYAFNTGDTQEFVFEKVSDWPSLRSTSTSVVSGKDYYIRSALNNLYLDESGSTAQSNAVQNSYSGDASQKWKAVSKGNGYFKFVNDSSGLCLDIPGAQNVNSLQVQVYNDLNNVNQEFKPLYDDDGTFHVVTHASSDDKCLDDASFAVLSGGGVDQYTYLGTINQQWVFEDAANPTQTAAAGATASSVSSGDYYICCKQSGLFLQTENDSNQSKANIIQNDFTGDPCQVWKITDRGDGYYKLTCENSNLAVDVPYAQNANSVRFQLWKDNNDNAQYYQIVSNGNGTYRILTKCSSGSKCFDMDSADVNLPGSHLNQYTFTGGYNQQWILYPSNEKLNRIESSAVYTSDGNYMASTTDARGNTTSYDYGQSLGANEYNKGLLRSVTDAKGNKTSYAYDTNTDDLLSESATADGITVANSYAYQNDQLSAITHNGFQYHFNYDAFGKASSVYVGSQKLSGSTYEANDGNLLSTSYGNGQTVSYAYDSQDRVTKRSYNGADRYDWVYDAQGNVGLYTDNVNGASYRSTYDFANRLVKTVGSDGHSVQYAYDKNSTLSKLIQSLNSAKYTTSYSFNGDNLFSRLSLGLSDSLSYNYDGLNRIANKLYANQSSSFKTVYTYAGATGGKTTPLVSELALVKTVGGNSSQTRFYDYGYDANGNLTSVMETYIPEIGYTYNELNELTRENNRYSGKTVTYTYDAGGNILTKTEYPYTTGALGTPTATYAYGYGDSNWKDKLTSYNGTAITYDAIGNPLSYYNGLSFTWEEGNQLATASGNGSAVSYKYNSDGIRTQKTVNGTVTKYYIEDGRVAWETSGADTIHYVYDADGDAQYMVLNGTIYYYERNAQNDVIGLIDSSMNEVVTYSYDTWGKLLSIGGSLASTVGVKNPYRYRGYRYDTETGLYYLQSRYYDPNTGRFVNADDTDTLSASTSELTDKNLFAYCGNNPVIRADDSGNFWHILVGAGVGFVIGGGISIASQLYDNGGNWRKINWGVAGANAAAGALSGALAATGVGLVGQVAGGAAIGMGEYAAEQKLIGKTITRRGLLASGIAGGVSGVIGGKGANGKNLRGIWKTSSKKVAALISKKKIAMYAAKKVFIKKAIAISAARYTAGSCVSAGINKRFSQW